MARISSPLENYDLTRKTVAVRTLDILTRLNDIESAKAAPNLAAIASMSSAIAQILAAVR